MRKKFRHSSNQVERPT